MRGTSRKGPTGAAWDWERQAWGGFLEVMMPEWNAKDKKFTRFLIHVHVHPMEYQVSKTGCARKIKPLLLIFVPLHLLEGVKLVTMMGKWGIALVQFVIKIE